MDSLPNVLLFDEKQTLRFFFEKLKDMPFSGTTVDELLYVSSVLAHFAITSRTSTGRFFSPVCLTDFFNLFVMDTNGTKDAEIMELAGAQSLFLVGFLRDQMANRHNVLWYQKMGSDFYRMASEATSPEYPKKRKVMMLMSRTFPAWAFTCHRLSRTFREEQKDMRLIRQN